MLEMYIQGADYADYHPRKGLVDIEKVTEWLRANIHDYLNEFQEWFEAMFDDLRKAMED